ncbi:hypothetical protein [Streptacidiphilus sp. EB129]|uniref:hypothetical protein n=1 Tax=Streptacidiphilus sp. EB129 TaxID=3156262 RepID=UPI00351260BB
MTGDRPAHAMTVVVKAQDEAGTWTEVMREETNGVSYVPVSASWPLCTCDSRTCPDRLRR